MSIQVAWDSPQRAILCFTFHDRWNWDDLYHALATGFEMADAVDHPVALVVDLRATAYLPEDLVSQLKRICDLRHANETIRIVVTDLSFWRSLYTVCTRLYPSAASRYFLVATPEQARQLVDSQRRRRQAS